MKKILFVAHNLNRKGGVQRTANVVAKNQDFLEIENVMDLDLGNTKPLVKIGRVLRMLANVYKYDATLHSNIKTAIPCLLVYPFRECFVIFHGTEVWNSRFVKYIYRFPKVKTLSVSNFTQDRVALNSTYRGSKSVRFFHSFWIENREGLLKKGLPHRNALDARNLGSILTVSRLDANDKHKRLDDLFEAIEVLQSKIPQIHLTVVGEGSDRNRLINLAKSLNIEKRITFLGDIPDDHLEYLFTHSQIFCLPGSPMTSGRKPHGEGYGLVFMEAAAFGMPSVSGSGDGSVEAVLDGVTGFNWDRAKHLSQLVGELLTNFELWEKMSINCQAEVQKNNDLQKNLQILKKTLHE
jgi:glycosyltransferase involved in cell wall biosynthesis